jgi:acyl-CoA synthetase (AMP-forming)/AMP-acid ligase II
MKKISSSLDTNPHIVQILNLRAAVEPDKLAFSFLEDRTLNGTAFTYADIDKRARIIAAELLMRHMEGERAVLLFQPGPDYIQAILGCWYAGVTAVPVFAPRLNTSYERVKTIVANSAAAVMLSTANVVASLESDEWKDLRDSTLITIATDMLDEALAEQWKMPVINENTLAVLQYTSGSTGMPKGVRLQHKHLITNSEMISRFMQSTSESVGVVWIPPYHDMGLIGGILQPLYKGFPVNLMAPASFLQRPMRWLEAISHFRGTATAAPNFAYDLCVKRAKPEQIAALDLSCLRVAGNGAEPIRAETMRRFAETFAPAGFDPRAFFPCYGMAETTLFVSGAQYGEGPKTLAISRDLLATGKIVVDNQNAKNTIELVSSGFPDKNVDIVIVDPQTSLKRNSGEVGEIWINGDTVADGYWQRPDATEETFYAALIGSDKKWLRTGDLGALVNDEVYVTGRIKDLIVIRGHNHYPHDIEATIQLAHHSIRPQGVAAFSFDTEEGESLGLVVELDRGWVPEDITAAEAAIRHHLSLEHQLTPASLTFVRANTIPKTSSGKTQRLLTRELLLKGKIVPLLVEESV